jgi:hypothetical protein
MLYVEFKAELSWHDREWTCDLPNALANSAASDQKFSAEGFRDFRNNIHSRGGFAPLNVADLGASNGEPGGNLGRQPLLAHFCQFPSFPNLSSEF